MRQLIVAILGHVDHGKTTLLDRIRRTNVTTKESGLITQHIGASEVPVDTIKRFCGSLMKKFKVKAKIPGLLFIDTPGHQAFTTLRKRGGSVADMAVLVVDINEGFKPQTDESLEILKTRKTPFVVAATKIDRARGWVTKENACFTESWKAQSQQTKDEVNERFYNLVGQLGSRGFDAARFDKVKHFRKNIAIIPCSGVTGEGIPELLVMLTGLAQQFLKKELELSDKCRGVVLEVKKVRGLGKTIDVILYDGVARKSNYLVVGGKRPIVTKIRSLLKPRPLKEIRVEKQFDSVDEVKAAAGIKIAASGMDKVVAGQEITVVDSEEQAKQEALKMKKEYEEFEVTGKEGIVLKADTIGALEALMTLFKNKVPIKRASIGNITKKDVTEVEEESDYQKLVVGFNNKVKEDAKEFAKDHGVAILTSDIVYKIVEDYEEWKENKKQKLVEEQLANLTRPAKLKILPNCTFRISKPAVVGVRVMSGLLNKGYLMNEKGERVGKLQQIQSQGVVVKKAKVNEEVAVSIEGPTVGRQINEEDVLYTDLSPKEYKLLIKVKKLIGDTEKRALEEIRDVKQKKDPSWGL